MLGICGDPCQINHVIANRRVADDGSDAGEGLPTGWPDDDVSLNAHRWFSCAESSSALSRALGNPENAIVARTLAETLPTSRRVMPAMKRLPVVLSGRRIVWWTASVQCIVCRVAISNLDSSWT